MERSENADLIVRVQQPGQSHITMPTGSIPNAYNTSILRTFSGDLSTVLQIKNLCYKQQSSVYLVTVYHICNNYIILYILC